VDFHGIRGVFVFVLHYCYFNVCIFTHTSSMSLQKFRNIASANLVPAVAAYKNILRKIQWWNLLRVRLYSEIRSYDGGVSEGLSLLGGSPCRLGNSYRHCGGSYCLLFISQHRKYLPTGLDAVATLDIAVFKQIRINNVQNILTF
jgi:hypothetical protein